MKKENLKKSAPKKVQPNQFHQPKKQVINNWYFDLIGLVIIILLGILIYSNSFNCSFHFDDNPSIIDNPKICNLFDVKALWNSSQTRFLPYYTFAVNYHFDKLNVWGYHLFNLVIHLINACLIYWLTLLIFSSPALKNYQVIKHKKAIALITALLFVSHPLATQSVTYIVQRMASMVTLFYLLSLSLYVKARLQDKNALFGYTLFAGSFISGVMAFLSKENAFTLPFAILLFELFFIRTKKISVNLKDYRVILVMAAFFGFAMFVLFKFSFSIFKPLTPNLQSEFRTITSLNYFFTQFSVIVKYVQLLFLPVNQNLDYYFPISNSIFELKTFLSFIFILCLVTLAIFLFKKNKIISFGILWFFLTLSIESGIIPISDLVFEHRTYLPSFGFFLILSSGIYTLFRNKYKYICISVFVFIIAANSFLTYQRNKIWKDDFTLWSDAVSKSPGKARPYFNLGNYFSKEKKNKQAVEAFTKAIELIPVHDQAYNNRGIIFMEEQRFEEAHSDFNKAISLNPKFAEAYNNRGKLLRNTGKYEDMLSDFNKAIKLNPRYAEAYNNRGNLFRMQKKYNDAIRDFDKAIDLNPEIAESYNNRGTVYMNEKKYNEAITDMNKAIKLNPDFAMAYANRGLSNLKVGKKENACMDLRKSVELGFQPAADFYNKNCH